MNLAPNPSEFDQCSRFRQITKHLNTLSGFKMLSFKNSQSDSVQTKDFVEMKCKQSSFKMRRELWSLLIAFLQLMSSTRSNFISVSQHGPLILRGTEYCRCNSSLNLFLFVCFVLSLFLFYLLVFVFVCLSIFGF